MSASDERGVPSEMVRALARLADLYWSDWRRSGRTREEFAALAHADWRDALVVVCGYVFERAGPAAFYRHHAVEAVKASTHAAPDASMPARVWAEYLRRLAGRRPNERLNPLNPASTSSAAITELAQREAAPYRHNLIAWLFNLLKTGKVAEASAALHRVPGVSDKIASFLLRDVACAFSLDERSLRASHYLQPIDVWTRRAAGALSERAGTTAPPTDRAAADLLCEAAWEAGVRPSDLNAGLWLLGAQLLAGDVARYKRALESPAALEAELQALERSARTLEAGLLQARATITGNVSPRVRLTLAEGPSSRGR